MNLKQIRQEIKEVTVWWEEPKKPVTLKVELDPSITLEDLIELRHDYTDCGWYVHLSTTKELASITFSRR